MQRHLIKRHRNGYRVSGTRQALAGERAIRFKSKLRLLIAD
jgi:hypothetical protein